MAYIEIVEKPVDPSQMDPKDLPDGKFKRLKKQNESGADSDSVKRIHDCTWYEKDILRVLNQDGVFGVTMIPMEYFDIVIDASGNEIEIPLGIGQSMVGVTEIVKENGPKGKPKKERDKVGDIMAASCDPIIDIETGINTIKKRYYEETN